MTELPVSNGPSLLVHTEDLSREENVIILNKEDSAY